MKYRKWSFFKNVVIVFLNKIQIYYFLEFDGGETRGGSYLFSVDDELRVPQLSGQKLLNFSRLGYAEISGYGRPTTDEIENGHIATKRLNNSR
jgi:hypothetical protein